MKNILAALLAAFFLFAALGCAAQSAPAAPSSTQAAAEDDPPVTPAEPEAESEVAPEVEPEIEPTPEPQTPSPTWQDAPHTEQFDLEEVVSCTYTLPSLTLATKEATETANAVFATLEQTILSYAEQTVYQAAQEKQAMGFLTGGYTIEEADDTLCLVYTISVSFSTETQDTRFDHSYTLSLATGELLKEA